jgi:hypothetical protein
VEVAAANVRREALPLTEQSLNRERAEFATHNDAWFLKREE